MNSHVLWPLLWLGITCSVAQPSVAGHPAMKCLTDPIPKARLQTCHGAEAKSGESGDESEEGDEEIILLDHSQTPVGPCGPLEPWNGLRVCAPLIHVNTAVAATLSESSSAPNALDVDYYRFNVGLERKVRLWLTGSLSPAHSLMLQDADGRKMSVDPRPTSEGGLLLQTHLGPGSYFIRVAGDSGSYDLVLMDEMF